MACRLAAGSSSSSSTSIEHCSGRLSRLVRSYLCLPTPALSEVRAAVLPSWRCYAWSSASYCPNSRQHVALCSGVTVFHSVLPPSSCLPACLPVMADGSRARSSSTLEAEEDAADGESKLDEAAGDVHDGYGREEEEGGGKRRSFGRSKASGYTSLSRDNTDRSQRVTDEHDEASKPQPTVPLSADPALHSSLVPASVPASAVAGVAVSVSSVLIAGAGFMCDAYDLFIMNVLLVVMGCQYGLQPTGDNICKLTSSEESSLASAVVVGAVSAATKPAAHSRLARTASHLSLDSRLETHSADCGSCLCCGAGWLSVCCGLCAVFRLLVSCCLV